MLDQRYHEIRIESTRKITVNNKIAGLDVNFATKIGHIHVGKVGVNVQTPQGFVAKFRVEA